METVERFLHVTKSETNSICLDLGYISNTNVLFVYMVFVMALNYFPTFENWDFNLKDQCQYLP